VSERRENEESIRAMVIVDGITWQADLVPLVSIKVMRDEVEMRGVQWDRQTLYGAPRELTLALRAAIDSDERRKSLLGDGS
jgi:hypothetical protein